MKKSVVVKSLALAAAAALALSGCAASGDATGKVITIGTSNDAPFSYNDEAGNLTGIDGEIWKEIAKCAGWETKVYVTDFATLIPSLESKKIDVIVDGMYITDERKKTINFTDTWYTEGEGMVVPADSTIKNRDDLKGKVLGAQTGTAFADFIKTLGGKEVKFFDSQAAIIAAVANKQVDAALTDAAVLGYGLVQTPNDKVKVVTPYEAHFPGLVGAGVRKDDAELLSTINKCLAEVKAADKVLPLLEQFGLNSDNLAKE